MQFLSVTNLSVSFRDHKILNNLNFEIKRDEVVAIVGANGVGKTVLFKSLLNLQKYEGLIKWHEDAKIGYVPQKLLVQSDLPLSVMEFLQLKSSSKQEVLNVLSQVGFKNKSMHEHHDLRVVNTRLGSLSGGELQRILIAYALLGKPNVLLLDEPTAGVDIEGEENFYELFAKLKKETDLTILFISHDQEIVKKYADRVILLKGDK